jgi:hypothetical protein
VLISRLSFSDGKLVLPDGMSYRLLCLDESSRVSLAALEKITGLVEAGATLVGDIPIAELGIKDDSSRYNQLVEYLWGHSNAKMNKVGKGRVFRGIKIREVLLNDGINPDFECSGVSDKGVIDYIHRKQDDTDIYFVASRWQPTEKVEATFRVSGKQPELWSPVTGEIRDLTDFRQEDGQTIIPLEFMPSGSFFIVFKDELRSSGEGKNYTEFEEITQLGGKWQVTFDPEWGGPSETTFNQLIDWKDSPENGIKYYSGKATYTKMFNLPENADTDKIFIDLGKMYEVAEVRLNGQDFGVIWTKPFRVEITSAIKSKDNKLEIDVVNLWPNRLIGDEFLSEEKRFTKTNIRKFTKATKLLPSGLIGPVTLLKSKNN